MNGFLPNGRVLRPLLGLLLCVASTGWAAGGPEGPNWEGLVGLEQGLWAAGGQTTAKTLWLRVEKVDDRWRTDVWGYARDYNPGDYVGVLAKAAQADGATELSVRIAVDTHIRDKQKGRTGLGEYQVRFKVSGTNLEGTWQGMFCGEAGQGKVVGTVEPPRPRAPNLAPPAAGEHPFLLLRRSDLAVVRKKLESPWGQLLLPKLTASDPESLTRSAVGHGLLYALTGDKKHAERAQQLIEADLNAGKWVRTEVHYPYVKVHDAGITAGEAALAFDLIRDGCTPEFRRNLTTLFARRAFYLWGCPANGSDTSNWSAMYRSGAGMCGLALLAEQEDFWPKPAEPAIVRLEADPQLTAAAGVPVAPLMSGQALADWLMAGPLPLGTWGDPTEVLGGPNARVTAGMKVSVTATLRDRAGAPKTETITRLFEPPKPAKGAAPGQFNISGGPLGQVRFLYTILENAEAGVYAISLPTTHKWFLYPYVFINGQRFGHGDHVQLAKGRYAVLAPVQGGHCRSNEAIIWSLKLTAVAEAAAQAWLAQKRAEYALDVLKWQTLQDAARAQGGVNPWGLYWARVGRQWIENWATWAVGSFGWAMAGECYTQHSYRAVLPFAHAYRNALGADLAGRPNLRMVLPRYAGQTLFREDGAFLQSYGPGGSALGVDNYARGFALVPGALKPAVLWAWNRTLQLAEAGKLKGAYLTEDFLDPMSAAFMLVNYVDAASGGAEQNPGATLPKVLCDDWKGGFAFRNGWRDAHDIVSTIYLNWNNAGGEWDGEETGDFRISGLGVDWAVRGAGWGCTGEKTPISRRAHQNIFELAEPVEQGGPAPARFLQASQDGSAVLTLDMNWVYASAKKTPSGRTLPPLPVHPRKGTADVFYDQGLQGLRAWAVDYSGASGAPALFAVVDKVAGTAGPGRWHFVTEKALPVTVAGNTFTVRAASGATLKGTVLAPASPTITTRSATLGHEAAYDGDHQTRSFERTVVDVAAQDFVFVVMTLQPGAAPGLSVQGAGESARATAGKQTVAFDGARIVLGHFAGDLPLRGPLAGALAK